MFQPDIHLSLPESVLPIEGIYGISGFPSPLKCLPPLLVRNAKSLAILAFLTSPRPCRHRCHEVAAMVVIKAP